METKQNRAANKTMVIITYKLTPQMQSVIWRQPFVSLQGPAKVHVNPPKSYLQKHSKEPKLPESEDHLLCVGHECDMILFSLQRNPSSILTTPYVVHRCPATLTDPRWEPPLTKTLSPPMLSTTSCQVS